MKQILIIEDDPRIAGLERDYLEAAGLQASVAADGPSGLRTALDGRFDLILLDIMLPGMDGLEVCRSIRREQNVPIILVSAKKEDLDKIKGLGVGADDYVVKPFSPGELVARVLAHISRYERLTGDGAAHPPTKDAVLESGALRLDPATRRAWFREQEVALTNKEFELLYFLAGTRTKSLARNSCLIGFGSTTAWARPLPSPSMSTGSETNSRNWILIWI